MSAGDAKVRRESGPLTPWEAREILGGDKDSGRPGYLQHHPDCTPPSDCLCNLFGIQNRLRGIAEGQS